MFVLYAKYEIYYLRLFNFYPFLTPPFKVTCRRQDRRSYVFVSCDCFETNTLDVTHIIQCDYVVITHL